MASDFKPFFMRGLAALLPTLVTIAIIVWAYQFVDKNLAKYITAALVDVYAWGGEPLPWWGIDEESALRHGDPIDQWDARTGRRLTAQYRAMTAPALHGGSVFTDEEFKRAQMARREAMWDLVTRKFRFFGAIGFAIAILLIYFMGYFLASFIGRTTWLIVERTIQRIPIIGAIYPNIKQVTDFFISDKKLEFSGVVAVQYPRKGMWSLGLITGSALEHYDRHDERQLVTVFIPSSPTPVMGYTITVAREDLVELSMTIDEAMRYTISAGVLKPHAVAPPRPATLVT